MYKNMKALEKEVLAFKIVEATSTRWRCRLLENVMAASSACSNDEIGSGCWWACCVSSTMTVALSVNQVLVVRCRISERLM